MSEKIVITWCNGKPAGIWCNDVVIWETKDVIVETNLLSTTVVLPAVAAVQFLTIFVNGVIANRSIELLFAIQMKITELKEIEERNKQLDLEIGDW